MPTGVYPRTEYHRRINSEGHKGIIAGMLGKRHSLETRRKITLANIGRKQSMSTKIKRGIYKTGPDHPTWNGGIKRKPQGYILQSCPSHPYADRQGYVRQHRIVIENIIGRYLLRFEEVHHIGTVFPLGTKENKADNRPQNLIAFANKAAHRRFERGIIVPDKKIIFDGRKLN